MTVTDAPSLTTHERIQAWIDQRPSNRPLRCWLLGYGPLGQAIAEGLLTCDPKLITLQGVFPWSSKPSEKRFASEPSEFLFRQWLKKQSIRILRFPSANHFQFLQRLLHDHIDVVIVATWGEILSPEIINQTQTLFINIHPSLLPHHRGPNPYAAVLMQQAQETGITAHVMDTRIDTGPIIHQATLTLHADDNGLTLRQRVADLAKAQLPTIVAELHQAHVAWPEQTTIGSYQGGLTPNDCCLNWMEDPIPLDHRLRAIYPWEQPWCVLPPWHLVFDSGRVIPYKYPGTFRAGQVIQRQGHHLIVATHHPNQAVMLMNPSLAGLWRILNPVVLPILLTPGRQL